MKVTKLLPGIESPYAVSNPPEEVVAYLDTIGIGEQVRTTHPYTVNSTVAHSLVRFLDGDPSWQTLRSDPNPKLPSTDSPADPKAQLKYPGLPSGRTASVTGDNGDC